MALLCLAATWKLVFAGRIIARGDLLLYFYPLRHFAAQALREGRLPLWNPYSFMGAPFLANSQAGFFYPFNMLLARLPVERATSLSIALHLIVAALCAYALARTGLGLSRLAAFGAGLAFGLGGYLGAQVEHLNQLQVLAWMPLAVLLVLRPLSTPRAVPGRIAALSGVIALQLTAGHTQSLYISCVTAGIAGLIAAGHRLRAERCWHSALPLLTLAGAALAAALLCGVQLLPTLELSGESFRSGGLPFNEAGSFSWRPWVIGRALLPTYGDPLFPEYVAYLGAVGLALLIPGTLSAWRAHSAGSHMALALVVIGFVLALGVVTPVFNALYKLAPGFNLFRAQARWLAMAALGAALLIGMGLQWLQQAVSTRAVQRWLLAWLGMIAIIAAGIVVGARISPEPEYASLPARAVLLGWLLATGVTTAGLGVLLWPRARRWSAPVAAALMAIELLAAAQFQPYARATDPGALTSLRPAVAHLLAERAAAGQRAAGGQGRTLALSGLFFDPGDKPEQELIFAQSLSADEIYDRLIASKHKEILSPNLALYYRLPSVDGYDGGLLPTKRFVTFTQQFAGDAARDGRLREFLKTVPDLRWLSQMGVRHVIADKTQDVFIDGVFYDLLFTTPLIRTREVSLQPYESTAAGLVFGLPNARAGETVGTLELIFDGDARERFPLVVPDGAPADGFHSVLRWQGPRTPLMARLTPADGARGLVLRGLTLIDERDKSFSSQIAYADALVKLAHSGDVKIYELAGDVAPRALLAEDPLQPVSLREESPEWLSVFFGAPLSAPATLILRDTCYPGWVARVAGAAIPIDCADVLFRSVRLPAGTQQVTFTYEPDSVRNGALLSLIGVGVWLTLLAVARRWR